jgi:D-3-phosphoglycerate dehydrogenase / 2-oxoglutarate reductase
MTKVLVATDKPFAAEAVTAIKNICKDAGFECALLEKYTEVSQLLDAVKDADAMIVRSDLVTPEVIAAAKQLKIVVRAGAGFDNIDLPAATARDIVVMNTPGQNSNAVAELAIGMMIYHARGQFNGKSGRELQGKTIGIHAIGNVGKRVATLAKAFDMKVYAFDPFIEKANRASYDATFVDTVEELYATSQYVSLHIPANAQTKNSIGYDLLTKMPKGAVLVNTARKEVINEADLLRVFEARPDFGYVSDVAPDCAAEVAEKYAGRFYFTPKKMGAQTEEANINAGIAAAKQIEGFIKNGDSTFKVN